MQILIIEDDVHSVDLLKGYILRYRPSCTFLPVCDSVADSVQLLRRERPDLIFMDIELRDGHSFEIFKSVDVISPIVFTTAFDNYLAEAFETNSIGYLLKPFHPLLVEKALNKWQRNLIAYNGWRELVYSEITAPRKYKSQFLVKLGQKLIPVKTEEINHFIGEDDIVYLVTHEKKKYMIDKALAELESLLDPNHFFRVSRKYILSKTSIHSLEYYTKGQVTVKARLLEAEKIVVSRQQTPLLKEWLNQ